MATYWALNVDNVARPGGQNHLGLVPPPLQTTLPRRPTILQRHPCHQRDGCGSALKANSSCNLVLHARPASWKLCRRKRSRGGMTSIHLWAVNLTSRLHREVMPLGRDPPYPLQHLPPLISTIQSLRLRIIKHPRGQDLNVSSSSTVPARRRLHPKLRESHRRRFLRAHVFG